MKGVESTGAVELSGYFNPTPPPQSEIHITVPDPDVLTVAETAARLRVGVRTFQRQFSQGRFPAWFVPVPWSDRRLFRRVDVDELLCGSRLQLRGSRREPDRRR